VRRKWSFKSIISKVKGGNQNTVRGTTVTTGARITVEKQNALRRASGEHGQTAGIHRGNSMSRTRPVSEGFLESNVTKLVTHNDQKTNALRAIKSKLLGDSGNSTGSGNEENQDGKKIDSINSRNGMGISKAGLNRTLSGHNKLAQSQKLQQKHGLKRSNTTNPSGSNTAGIEKLRVSRNASDSQAQYDKKNGLDPAGIGDAKRRFNLETSDNSGSILDKYISNARETAKQVGKQQARGAVESKKESESDYTNSSASNASSSETDESADYSTSGWSDDSDSDEAGRTGRLRKDKNSTKPAKNKTGKTKKPSKKSKLVTTSSESSESESETGSSETESETETETESETEATSGKHTEPEPQLDEAMEANYPNFNSAVENNNGLDQIRELMSDQGMSETEAAAMVAVHNAKLAKIANHPKQIDIQAEIARGESEGQQNVQNVQHVQNLEQNGQQGFQHSTENLEFSDHNQQIVEPGVHPALNRSRPKTPPRRRAVGNHHTNSGGTRMVRRKVSHDKQPEQGVDEGVDEQLNAVKLVRRKSSEQGRYSDQGGTVRQNSDQGRPSDQGRQMSDQGRIVSDQGRQFSDQGQAIQQRQFSDQGRPSDQGRQMSDQGRQFSDQGRQFSDQGQRQFSDQGRQRGKFPSDQGFS